ncbi:threonine ammonia-lyase [Nakamurella lactea]|uniref:threonine ammonia-lyase n=1 Tax=Nakamurella lactea TaxID=459515 RepID=UPI000406FCF6|nr:threonine/serine dehydratase [Nakamurella lactea]
MSDTVTTDLVTIDEIHAAARRIAGHALRTPLLPAPWADTAGAGSDADAQLWLKAELLQPMGAFKIRGAINAIAALDPAVRAGGVLAHSSGNHAQAVALAAKFFGIDAHIVIPDNAPPRKIAATEALGATVELVPLQQRFTRPLEIQAETGKPMIPPYDDRNVIAGQGTITLEIAEEAPDVAVILVPVSGGGLISGIAAAAAAVLPNAKVIGVEPELAGDAAASFAAGEKLTWKPEQTARTIADGLRTFSVGDLPWQHIRAQVHDIITVTEDEIRDATRQLTLRAHLASEPSGAVATAAHLHHSAQLPPGKRVAIVSGGNIDPAVLRDILS